MKRQTALSALLALLLPACATSPVPSSEATSGGWRLTGSTLVRPVEIHDDGERIFLAFADDQELPAVFGMTRSGDETLVNGHMRAGSYVIDELYPVLVFRLGKDVARASKGAR